ncbi:MAG: cyclase family protein [Acholeplasmataceae bacterium]|nr:cyclase family protein [Acholeplasmataceae bacterium]
MRLENGWLDLSRLLRNDSKPFPGDPSLEINKIADFDSEGYLLTKIATGMHLGTHIDFPAHFLNGGKSAADYPVNRFIGIASRIDIAPVRGVIGTETIIDALDKLTERAEIVVLCTGHGQSWGDESYYSAYPYFEVGISEQLANRKVGLLFTDLPTVAYENDDDGRLHRDLLGKDILIGENLSIPKALGRRFYFCALPLPIFGIEASIVRAIAKNI